MTTTRTPVTVVTPADDVPGPPQGCWTYDDYAAIPDDGRRYEVIEGVLYIMPGPRRAHQSTVLRFGHHLLTHVELTGVGWVLIAPFDVTLGVRSTVQPDVLVILRARADILTEKRVVGAPDLVIEVASPSTAGHDRRRKQDAYAGAGVREYWIAHPYERAIEVLVLEGKAYRSLGVFENGDKLPSVVLPELPVTVEQFFP